jgi:hypothetical protein
MTFRTITEDSVGWYLPPMPGYQFAARTVEAVRQQVTELVGEAARDDVVDVLNIRIGKDAA